MSSFVATKPVSNFIFFWLINLVVAYISQNVEFGKTQVVFDFLLSLIFTGLLMLWPFCVYKYLCDRKGGQTEYSGFDIGKWILVSTVLIGVWFTIEKSYPEVAEGPIYYAVGVPVMVLWLTLYVVLNWNASNMLDSSCSRKYGHCYHIPSFFGFLIWPAGGIFFVGDRLLRLSSGRYTSPPRW
jgi:hypothetical protein